LRCQEIPDADRAGHHGAALEIRNVVLREGCVDGRAKPGVESIDGTLAGNEAVDDGARTLQT
jgi:hypothetical protein